MVGCISHKMFIFQDRITKEKGLMSSTPNPLSEISPSPSSFTTPALALVSSSSGKRKNQTGKKNVKQVTGRHNDIDLHLAAQWGDLAAAMQILGGYVFLMKILWGYRFKDNGNF